MIEMAQQKRAPYGNKTVRFPPLTKEAIKSHPIAESPSQMIEAVIGKYPVTTLVGGFAFGGLLGWLLKR
jgi:hypothetical protein